MKNDIYKDIREKRIDVKVVKIDRIIKMVKEDEIKELNGKVAKITNGDVTVFVEFQEIIEILQENNFIAKCKCIEKNDVRLVNGKSNSFTVKDFDRMHWFLFKGDKITLYDSWKNTEIWKDLKTFADNILCLN